MLDNSDFIIHESDFRFADKSKHLPKTKKEEKIVKARKKIFLSFLRKPSSIVGLSLLFVLLLLAFIPPIASSRQTSFYDGVYAYKLPKIDAFERSGFWDGSYELRVNEKKYYSLISIGAGSLDKDGLSFDQTTYKKSNVNPINKVIKTYKSEGVKYRDLRVDSYYEVGFTNELVSEEVFNKILTYEERSKLKVLYPLVDTSSEYSEGYSDANMFYYSNGLYPCNSLGEYISLDTGEALSNPKEQNLKIFPNYLLDSESKPIFYKKSDSTYSIRVLYYNYYQFKCWSRVGGSNYYHSPSYAFGSDAQGYDIFLRTSSGIRLSLFLSLIVFVINYVIGSIYGILEGYYGGKVDFILFYLAEIIRAIPFFVIATLFAKHFVSKGTMTSFVGLFLAFILAGWISIASQTRRQIYRFKNREFVFASRQLGGKDIHIIAKHVYPHAISSLITSLVLYIPGIIFNETALSFLGVIDLNGPNMVSLGTLIANGQQHVGNFPHIILLPAIVISILMIAFNLIGNGLREAYDNDTFRKKKK